MAYKMEIGDLVSWEYSQFSDDGACLHKGVAIGIILQVLGRALNDSGTQYRIMFHERDEEPYDLWLNGWEIKKVSNILNKP